MSEIDNAIQLVEENMKDARVKQRKALEDIVHFANYYIKMLDKRVEIIHGEEEIEYRARRMSEATKRLRELQEWKFRLIPIKDEFDFLDKVDGSENR